MIEILGIWIAAGFTLCIFSFLYKDNPFYKFAEHVYVGASAAYMIILVFSFNVKPMLIDKFRASPPFPWVLLIPTFLSALMLCRFIPQIAWVSRWAIAFTVGIGAGVGFTLYLHGYILPQLHATMLPLNSPNNIIIVIGVLATLVFFYFSTPHRGAINIIARIGRIFIMIAFGASFGYTVMARVSLLIGRIHFLLRDWLHLLK